jgi:hypothetical protein
MKDYLLFSLREKTVRGIRLLMCCVISAFLSGCYMHPVVSKTHWYPSDKDYESAEYLLYIEVHGEKREAYTATTKKRATITIWKGKSKLLVRDYVCTAASLEWDVVWNQLDDLNIVFFDFPEGISIYDEKAVELPAKQIFSLRFTYDSQAECFTEYPIPQKILRHVKMPNKRER